jgi:predicted phosphodiesterase
MKIGLITDVHEYAEVLAALLQQLRDAGAEKIYFLGDLCLDAENLQATCKLLLENDVAGVWGNHDYGLCEMARKGEASHYGDDIQEYCAHLQPSLTIDGLYMAHVEPWLDPNRFEDLWYLEGLPESEAQLQRLFAPVGWDIAFAGHFHRWFHATPMGVQNWDGKSPRDLSDGRHYIIISACFSGYAAIFDTKTRLLTPVRCTSLETEKNFA